MQLSEGSAHLQQLAAARVLVLVVQQATLLLKHSERCRRWRASWGRRVKVCIYYIKRLQAAPLRRPLRSPCVKPASRRYCWTSSSARSSGSVAASGAGGHEAARIAAGRRSRRSLPALRLGAGAPLGGVALLRGGQLTRARFAALGCR